MAFIPETNRPGTHTSGASDNTLNNPVAAMALTGAVGAIGGVGLGMCMTLAPRTTIGIAALCFAAGAATQTDRLQQWGGSFGPN